MNNKKSFLLGVGFDAKDGHKRITKGKNFYIFGGSKQTHGLIQERCIRFNEELGRRHKTLDEIGKEEFYNIAEKIGFKTSKEK